MPREKKQEEQEEGAPSWMVTFSDMVTLILTFFVLLVSMMVVDPKKFVEVLGVFQRTSGEGYDKPLVEPPIPTESFFVQIIKTASRRSSRPDGGEIPSSEGEAVTVFAFKENYVVKMADQPFFGQFEIRLTEKAKQRLDWIAQILKKQGGSNKIRLIGHYSLSEGQFRNPDSLTTDQGSPVKGIFRPIERYNHTAKQMQTEYKFLQWPKELSYLRSLAVQEYLVSQGIPRERMELTVGDVISDVRVGIEKQTRYSPQTGVGVNVQDTEIHAGSAESKVLNTPVVNGLELRPWQHFIFTEGGDDRGRTVEIIVTGELVGSNESFAPALSD